MKDGRTKKVEGLSHCTLWLLRVRCKIHPFKGEMQNLRPKKLILSQGLATWVKPFMLLVLLLLTWIMRILWYLYTDGLMQKVLCYSIQYLEFTAVLIPCNHAFSPFQVSIKWPKKRIFGESEAIKKKHHLWFTYSYLPKAPHNPYHIISLNNYAYHSLALLNVFFDTRFHSLNRLTFPYCLTTFILLLTSLLLQVQDAMETQLHMLK